MNRLIPVPSDQAFPEAYREGDGPICAKLDSQFSGWLDEALGLGRLNDISRMPAASLEELGYQLSAGIRPDDSDAVRRSKVAVATVANASRGLWGESVKPIVEARSGAGANIIVGLGDDDFILAATADEATSTWSVLGGLGGNEGYGIRLATGASEAASIETVFGVVFIDCGTDSMSAADVLALVGDLVSLVPAYFKVYLGYVQGGLFVQYPNGEVN